MEEEHWVLFSKEGCPHCVNAKQLLSERLKVKANTTLNIIPKEKYDLYKEKFHSKMQTWPRVFILKNCS